MRAAGLVLVAALVLAACGKVGPLRLPPEDDERARTAAAGTPA